MINTRTAAATDPRRPTPVRLRGVTTVLELAGTAVQRGEAHGEQARHLIAETCERWQVDVAGRHLDPGAFLTALVDETGFRATAARCTPDLVAEIDGIARGSGLDARMVWALNLLDEGWWLRQRMGASGGEHCSGFGLRPGPGQPCVIGQNMDLAPWLDGLQVLLDIRPTEGAPRMLAPSYPGMVATNAMNEHGIGVCVNTLSSLPTDPAGLPVALVIRLLAAQPTFADAIDALKAVPHASGQNYIVGAPDAVADFECGAGWLVAAGEDDDRIAHTNHPLADHDPAAAEAAGPLSNTFERLEHLRRRLHDIAVVGPAAAAEFLAETPLCRGADGDTGFTFYAIVMELTATPTMHLTSGPPSAHAFVPYRF